MIYEYKCKKCGNFESNEEAFNPREEILCKCGLKCKRVFIPNRNIYNRMLDKTTY